MIQKDLQPRRFIGLDVHKHYLICIGVDEDLNQVLGPQRVKLSYLEKWMSKTLCKEDAIVLEMTTNTWQLYEDLLPHVALITRAQVMTDKIAASILARLHAKGLLVGIWVPPKEVQELRALIAHRNKMTRLATQAKNRLHAILHRGHIQPPEGNLFQEDQRDWWLGLELSPAKRTSLLCDLDVLDFAQQQVALIEITLKGLAAEDQRVPLLVQLPGIRLINALTILGAIGEITRFPSAKKLVGYAGLGGRVHDSGQTRRRGGITKAGRRDLRTAMVRAAQTAANTHPHWKAELKRLQPRLGRNKAIVAIARKLLVSVWYVLTNEESDRFAEPEMVARKLLQYAYTLGKANRPASQRPGQYVRDHLDRLGLGADLTAIPSGAKKKPQPLPPSALLQNSK